MLVWCAKTNYIFARHYEQTPKRESDCGETRVNRMEQEDWQRLKEEMGE